jgi:repressor LexA
MAGSAESRLFYLAVGKNIKKYRDLRNYSLQTLAEKVGLTKKTIQRYENGEIKIDMNRLSKISEALDIEISKMLEGTESFLGISLGDLKVINLPIVKHFSLNNNQEIVFNDIEGYEPAPAYNLTKGEYFYLRPQDNTLLAGHQLHFQDLILVHRQQDVAGGDLVAFLFRGEVFCRKLYRHNESLFFQAENQEDIPLVLENEKCFILGKIVKILINLQE